MEVKNALRELIGVYELIGSTQATRLAAAENHRVLVEEWNVGLGDDANDPRRVERFFDQKLRHWATSSIGIFAPVSEVKAWWARSRSRPARRPDLTSLGSVS